MMRGIDSACDPKNSQHRKHSNQLSNHLIQWKRTELQNESECDNPKINFSINPLPSEKQDLLILSVTAVDKSQLFSNGKAVL